jgi:hypothetical protein
VNAALQNPPEHTPASATGESLPAQVVPNVAPQKRSRALVAIPVLLAGVVLAAIAVVGARDEAIGAGATPNVVASDRQARGDDVRGRAPASTPGTAPSTADENAPVPTHVHGATHNAKTAAGPTPASAPATTAPAGFAPRPNPYDKH